MIDKLTPRQFKADQDERLTPPSVFIDALNITLDTDDSGNAGVVKNIKGTNTVTDSTGIDYTGETIEILGTCRDPERRRTYIFVYCSTGSKQAILQYSDSNNTLTTVLKTTHLAFRSGDAVASNIINGDFRRDGNTKTLLYFTDNSNPPRKINVDEADEYVGLSGTRLKKRLSVMKGTSLSPPKPWLIRDTAISSVSNFQKGSFQFAFQYIYLDGEVSALSPYSKYVFGQKRVEPTSTISTIENVCKILIPMADRTPEVSKIRLLFRENNGFEVSPFRIIDEFDPTKTIRRNLGDVQDYVIFEANNNVYTFLNNGYNGFLPSSEEDRPFSNVPKRAKTQAIINSRLVYGNYVDGYDNLADPDGINGSNGELPNVDFSVTYHDLPSDTSTETTFPAADETDENITILTSQSGVNVSGGNTVRLNFDSASTGSQTAGTVLVGDATNKLLSNVSWVRDDATTGTYSRDDKAFSLSPFEVSVVLNEQVSLLTGNDSVREQLNDALQDFTVSGDGNSFLSGTDDLGNTIRVFYDYEMTPKLFDISDDFVLRYVLDITPHSVLDVTNNELYPVSSFTKGYDADGADQVYTGVDADEGSYFVENPSHTASFTSGSNHTIAFSYIDAEGRYGPAQEVGSFYVEPIGSGNRSDKHGPVTVKMSPTHEPPAWAVRYATLYAGPDDIDDMYDMYVDDATMIRKTTKTFPFEKPDSVFINITSYAESMQRQGIDFGAAYSFEPGDYVRVISKRNTSTNGSFSLAITDPDDGTGGTSNPHDVEATTTYWDDFTANLRPAGDGTTVDFPVLGVYNVSSTTDISDYAFGTNAIGQVVPGTYLELEVPRNAVGWGSDNFQFLAGPHERRTVGTSTIPRSIIGDGGLNNGGASGFFYSWWGANQDAIGLNQADVGDGDLSAYNDNWANAFQIPWKVFFRDQDDTAHADSLKQLHRHSAWDKGVRIHLIKPKKHSKSRVYHEIGLTKEFVTKAGISGDHGNPEYLSDGYSWFRRVDSSDPFEGVTTVPAIAWTANPSNTPVTVGYDGDTNGGMGDTSRVDNVNSSYGGRVRPIEDEANHFVESFYTFPGSLEKVRNIGRLNVTSLDGEKRRDSSLIHSNFFGSESLYLTVHDFEATSFKDLDINNGAINALSPTDQYLTVFQNSKVSKVPVNRNVLQTAAGVESLTVSNQVLGAEQSYVGSYGVDTNQTAVINVDNVMYFIDKNRRAIIRLSNQGMNIISDIDISEMIEDTFISNKGSSANYAIGFDRERNYVFFTFQGDETYGYDHIKKLWTSKYSFNPVGYAFCEDDMLSFKRTGDGSICHRHNNEAEPAEFYGTDYVSQVKMVSLHKNPSVVKSYNAIGIQGSEALKCTVATSDQSIELDASDFNEKEDRFYTEIFADDSNLKTAYKTRTGSDAFSAKGHVVPLGKITGVDSKFTIEGMARGKKPANENRCLVWWDDVNSRWVSILHWYIVNNSVVGDGFIAGSQITGSTDTTIEASGYYASYTHGTHTGMIGKYLGYIVVSKTAVGDTTYSGTLINQPYAGKKLRDYYATVTVEAAADGTSFELYGVDVDADVSNIHM